MSSRGCKTCGASSSCCRIQGIATPPAEQTRAAPYHTDKLSSFPGDNEDPQAVSAFQKKLELLTEAVLSIAPSAAQPAEPRKNSSSSASSSSQNAAPDLRCWDSCCRGRKFSTKSNMIRHRRERLGQVGKCCSICNAYFTRRSVCNAHEANRMCRPTKGNHSY